MLLIDKVSEKISKLEVEIGELEQERQNLDKYPVGSNMEYQIKRILEDHNQDLLIAKRLKTTLEEESLRSWEDFMSLLHIFYFDVV